MKHVLSFETYFESGHTIMSDPICDKPGHGHRWLAKVTIESTTSPDLLKPSELPGALDQIHDLLHRRSLNIMLPGTVTNTLGVANWLWDQLVMKFPLLVVEVSADGQTSRVSRD